jgi:hypothetical protein
VTWILAVLFAVLPQPGTQFHQLPDGPGKSQVESACYACHSADLLAQQRLTDKQWTKAVDKMIGWGAVVAPADKDVIVQYLAKHYGPTNRFVPLKTAPK